MFLQVEYVGPSQNLTSGWAYAGYTSKHNQTYMAGGRREENLCYAAKYDPQTDAWINLPKLPRLVLPATDKNGKTCVFMSEGFCAGRGVSSVVERLSLVFDSLGSIPGGGLACDLLHLRKVNASYV